MPKKLSTTEYVTEAIKVHGDVYDYSKTVYHSSHKPVTIICKIHGEFSQKACNHIHSKSGCPLCAGKQRTTNQAIEQMKTVHGDQFDYSEVVYEDATTKLKIICREHGPFYQSFNAHVSNKSGCPQCKGDKYNLTIKQRYGVSNVMLLDDFKNKQKETNLQRYGVEHAASSTIVKEKIKQTNLERYGTEAISHLPDIDAKRKKTCELKYGADHPWKNEDVRAKIKTTMSDLYGSENFNQAHIAPESLELLNNKQWLVDQHIANKLSYTQIAKTLNVDMSTVANYAKEHDIETQRYSNSLGEQEIAEFIEQLGVEVIRGDRTTIAPLELDIFVPSHKIAIEFCGLYWHREHLRPRLYHYNKMKLCEQRGIRLLTIYEDEWYDRQHCVENKIKRLLKADDTEKVYARKCTVMQPSQQDAKRFLDINHIQGAGPGSIKYALSHNNEIVAIMTFVNEGGGNYVLSRYATSKTIAGGFTKLLAHFKRNHTFKHIKSFADLRLSDGNMYASNGWVCEGLVSPDYFWCKGTSRHHKFAFRHINLPSKLSNYDPSLSESENCYAHGYFKVYDCGKLKFVINNR